MLIRRKDPIVVALEAAGLSSNNARRLATAGTPVTVESGFPLCREGESGTQAFVLVDGEAVVKLQNGDRIAGPGEVLGEMAVLAPSSTRMADVETTTRSTVLVFDVRTFRGLAESLGDVLSPARAA
ncbi:MAG: cyclic nucleotide-binding domain-containing protein [Acidimicrobiales bacterium]|nr:cyclic nucleotide-binding domain-containing protein [Acidimicrobiales bacterium]